MNLDHSKNEFNRLKLKDYIILSFIHKLKGKISHKASGIIIGLLLNEDDEPEKFKPSLTNSAAELESVNLLDISNIDFEKKLKEIYIEYLEALIDIMDPEVVKKDVINSTKNMLSGGKKERKIAQELLEKIEANVHIKISEYYKIAENALKSLDYDKSDKFFNKAAEVAEELLEDELAATLRERAKFSVNIPSLSKNLESIVQKARTALRKEDFHGAYTFYKEASDISKELMQTEKEEEYGLKSKALQDFYQVDQRFKKKK